MENKVYIVFKLVSEYSTEEIVCVCASKITAEYEQSKIKDAQSRIEEFILQ